MTGMQGLMTRMIMVVVMVRVLLVRVTDHAVGDGDNVYGGDGEGAVGEGDNVYGGDGEGAVGDGDNVYGGDDEGAVGEDNR